MLGPAQLVQSVERSGFVALREGRIVENAIHEIFHRASQREHRLTDVKQFGRAFADDVDAEQQFRVGAENQFEAPGGIAADLAARDFAEVGDADFVGDAFVGELLFRFADKRNFGNGVNAVRVVRAIGMYWQSERVRSCDAALFHRDGCQAREADHVADRENIWLRGAVVCVHRDAPAIVGFEARGGEIQFVHIALPAHRVKQRFARDFFLALEISADPAFRSLFDALDFFIEPERDATIAQVVAESFDHFGVCELKQARPLLDENHAHPERCKHAGVLDANDSAADHDQRFRNIRHLQNLVAVDDVSIVEWNERRVRGLGSRRDDDVGGFIFRLVARADHADVVRIDEAGHTGEHFDAVARKLRADHVHLCLDHMLRAKAEVSHRDLLFHAIVDAVDALIVETGKMKDRFADRLAGDGAGIYGRAADHFKFFDERDTLAVLCGLNGGALSRGPGPDDDKIEFFHRNNVARVFRPEDFEFCFCRAS